MMYRCVWLCCLLQKSMSTYVSDCYDSIAVFLCIHIILRFRAITAKRNIPALDKSVARRQITTPRSC